MKPMAVKKTRESKAAIASLPIYLVILKQELARRLRANPRYSLRSFAKQIDVDVSLLSKILQGKRPLTTPNAKRILKKAKLPAAEKMLFWKSFVQEKEGLYGEVDPATDRLIGTPEDYAERPLAKELFSMIADPNHYVMTELTRIPEFKSDPKWIAKRLGISEKETIEGLGRLLKVGLIRKEGAEFVRVDGRHVTDDTSVTGPANKFNQRKILERSLRALDQIPIERRNHTAMTIAINPDKIPLAKKMLADFMNQLSDVLEAGTVKEVYQVSFGLFPATDSEGDSP